MAVPRDTVTFVCTGNTCRSPMAEALLRAALAKRGEGLGHLRVVSYGLAAAPGEPASPHSVKAMARIGLDISAHRSRPLSPDDLARSVAVFAMTGSHLDALSRRADLLPEAVLLLRDVLPPAAPRAIPDPFGGDFREYEDCRDSMVEAMPALLEFLRLRFSR
jgi:protein-tyrosine phosphatase